MQVWALITWWYGTGWAGEFRLQARRLGRVEGFFAFDTLLRTLFQPFRQIDAGSRRGGLSVQFRAWLDKSISRFIGASARLVLLLAGALWWCVSALTSACWLMLWPLLPVMPIIGAFAALLRVGSL